MAELTPIPSAQRPAEANYQPVSGYAVAAILTASAFAIFTIVLIYVGIRQQRTPLSYEVLVLAAGGIVLSIIGRSQIKNSEGTRTGLRLTATAWWICVLGGAGFGAFLKANELFLERESRRAADAFFDDLKNGRMHNAFLMHMMPPEQRGRAAVDAPDFEQIYAGGGYLTFANNEIIRLFQRNGMAVTVEHVGSRDVGQENNGFKTTHSYRIASPEGVFDVDIKMVAVEPKRAGEKLQWYTAGGVNGLSPPKPDFLSQYGRARIELEMEGDQFGKDWMKWKSIHRSGPAHLMTLPTADRDLADKAFVRAFLLGGWVPTILDIPAEFLPGERARRGKVGVEDLIASGFFRSDDDGSPIPADKLDALRTYYREGQIGLASPLRSGPSTPDTSEKSTFIRTPTSITIAIPVEMTLGNPHEITQCTIGVVCTEPAIVNALNAAFEKGKDLKDDGMLTRQSMPARNWRVAWFKTNMEVVNTSANVNGPPGRAAQSAAGGGPR